MKKYLASCLMLGAVMVLTGMPLQLLQIDSVKSAYAFSSRRHGGQSYIFGNAKRDTNTGNSTGGDSDGNCNTSKVPEPATLALIGSGIAGIGIYGYLRRKNRK